MVVSFSRQAAFQLRRLGGFHAKLRLCSRKEGEMLRNPLSQELRGASALPGSGAAGAAEVRAAESMCSVSQWPSQQDLRPE